MRRTERAARSGDSQDRVRLLVDRMRAGEVNKRYLELAAFLGDDEAADATGLSHQHNVPVSDEELEGWVDNLEKKVYKCDESFYINMRVAVAAAQFVAETYINYVRGLEHDNLAPLSPDELLELVSRPPNPPSEPIMNERLRARVVQELCGGDEVVAGAAFVYEALCDELLVVSNPNPMIEALVMTAEEHVQLLAERDGQTVDSVSTVYQAIKSDLIPWLRGEGDPVKERVLARQHEREAQQRIMDARKKLDEMPGNQR